MKPATESEKDRLTVATVIHMLAEAVEAFRNEPNEDTTLTLYKRAVATHEILADRFKIQKRFEHICSVEEISFKASNTPKATIFESNEPEQGREG